MKVELGKHYRIDEIVPHSGFMSFLDELLEYDHEQVVAQVTIREQSEFFVPGRGVPAWVGLEYMAQAVSAFSGIEDEQRGRRPRIGLLLGTRRYRCFTPWFALGARLRVTAHLQLRGEHDLVAFHCVISCGDRTLTSADVKGICPEDLHAVLAARRQLNVQR